MTAPVLPQPGQTLTPKTIDDLIGDMSAWRSTVSDELLALDEQVRLSGLTSSNTDLTLAFVLWRALAARLDEIIGARGTSSLNRDDASRISALVWAPIVDPADGALAGDLAQARTIFDALLASLHTAVGQNSAKLAANAALLGPITERVTAARLLAGQLGDMTNQIETIAAKLGRLGPTQDPGDVASAVAQIDAELKPVEVDLLSIGTSRNTLDDDIDATHRRVTAAIAVEHDVREIAARCHDKIAHPPRLGIPSVAVLGPVPGVAAGEDWRTTRANVDAFRSRLDRVERALALAKQTFGAPLERRADLRGLLDSYRAMAGATGLGERADASAAYDAAHDSLWSAPCDVDAAAELVAAYQRIVTAATEASATGDRTPPVGSGAVDDGPLVDAALDARNEESR